MKITNKYNLPLPFVLAVSPKNYDNGGSWRTVTELIGPPKIAHLKRKHDDEIEEDVSERTWSFQGAVVHKVVEESAGIISKIWQKIKSFFKKNPSEEELIAQAELSLQDILSLEKNLLRQVAKTVVRDGEWMSEQRLFAEIQGKKISGAYDLYNPKTGELIDVKNSTAWKAKKGEAPKEWIEQTNCLAELLRRHGFPVSKIGIVLVIRDFSKPEASRSSDYPQAPVVYLPVDIWESSRAGAFLEERVKLHLEAEEKEAMCSPEDRWAKPDTWAIKKKGQSRAIPGGLFAVEEKAREELAKLGSGYVLEYREGENVRCALYCPVAKFCAQYQKMLTRKDK